MRIAIPKETKPLEGRVSITPLLAAELILRGHEVWMQRGAGRGAGYPDRAYEAEGVQLTDQVAEIWSAELIVKVKEPNLTEAALLTPAQTLFCFLHLAAAPKLAKALCASGAAALGFETVRDASGGLPLLRPMSQIAGRVAVQEGACLLESVRGGKGILIGGIEGSSPAQVTILGAGNAGSEAALVALGMGATVTLLDAHEGALARWKNAPQERLSLGLATASAVEEAVRGSDLVIGAALIPGERTPFLISRTLIEKMEAGSILADISIDQGGIAETSRPTALDAPTYVECGILHYTATNIPAACSRTATEVLSYVLRPFLLALADGGVAEACAALPGLQEGLQIEGGRICHPAVSKALSSLL